MSLLSRFKRVAVLAVAAAAAVTIAPLTASAATSNVSPAKASVVASLPQSNYRSPVVYIAPGGSSVTPQVTGNGSSISASHSVGICPDGCGTLVQAFNTTYDRSIGIITSCFQNMNGSGSTDWTGFTPLNADRMTLNQNIWVSGVGVSISIGSSVGAGVSVSNNTVYFSESGSNTWQLSHSFTNIRFCTKIGAIGPYENSRDSATFGTHTYTDFIN